MIDVDDRIAAVEALLRAHGIPTARVDAVGQGGEIAAVSAPLAHIAVLTELAPRIKALGFRYVAMDLAPWEGRG